MEDEDLSVFFDDWGKPVTALGITEEKGGILDMPQEYIGPNGEVMVTDYELYVKTDVFGGLRQGALITVAGEQYRVARDARKRDDGSMSIVALNRYRPVAFDSDDTVEADSIGAY
ncbi:MAG: hypothetical protein AAFX65_10595 [Cyanobacteria bacterium J06638_7]